MSDLSDQPAVVSLKNVRKNFRQGRGESVAALNEVSIDARRGMLTALVGPDGAGKTTLLRLAAGLMTPDAGQVHVLGFNVAVEPQSVQDRVGYMPQRFGLYEDLSVQENLDLYADLHGVSVEERQRQYPRLMSMTALGSFTRRLAGRLSGGMKQKLGLACVLVGSPPLLLLDEPTVGVDPLSRRELWEIIEDLVRRDGLTVLLSTGYMDEAARCGHTVVMHEGKVLAQGKPAQISAMAAGKTFLAEPEAGRPARWLQARLLDSPEILDAVPEGGLARFVCSQSEPQSTRKDAFKRSQAPATNIPPRILSIVGARGSVSPVPAQFEDGFMVLFRQARPIDHSIAGAMKLDRQISRQSDDAVVEVRDLVKTFGDFTAVDHVTFQVRRGEIFGLLGPNGAGKTTTFRMLCGLLPATSGTLRVAGEDLGKARAEARRRIGYVAQKFSLYGALSVTENLEFFGGAYGLRGARRRDRIGWAMTQFELAPMARVPSGQLPGGYKQRLAMAAALLHEPEILFLDEPTSGADPLARREFWRRITALAEQGVTVIVTTHFMEEAEYCDHVVIQDAGKVLSRGTPAEIRRHADSANGQRPTMNDAFIAIVEQSRGHRAEGGAA